MIVYLDEPIFIEGVKIGHTYEGLKHLVEHYSRCMEIATPQQMNDKARAHCQSLITDYQLHIKLYEKYSQQLNPIQQ